MPFLALIASLAFWPGFAEASNTPKWALLFIFVPLMLVGRGVRITHHGPWLFLLWGCAVSIWGPWLDSLAIMWRWATLVMVFYLAGTMTDREFRWTVYAAAVGVSVSGFLAIFQAHNPTFLGIHQGASPSGLLMNKNYLGEAGVVLLIACLILRNRWLSLFLLPAWLIPKAKMAILTGFVLIGALVWRRARWLTLVMGVAGVLLALVIFENEDWRNSSLGVRTTLIGNTVMMIADNPLGRGAGGYWRDYPLYHDAFKPTHELIYDFDIRPRTAHNESLTILAEFGLPGFACIAWILVSAFRRGRNRAARYGLLALLGVGLSGFPLYIPTTAFLAVLFAGYLCGSGGASCEPDAVGRGVTFRGAARSL